MASRQRKNNKSLIIWRFIFVSMAISIVSFIIVYRLVQTTVVKADAWNEKAAMSFNDTVISVPERGRILADNGAILAANVVYYDAIIDWESEAIKADTFYHYLPALADSMACFFPNGKNSDWWRAEFEGKFKKRGTGARGLRSYKLASDLTYAQKERLRKFPFFKKGRNKSGLVFYEQYKRCKPFGDIASRSIGSVHADARVMHGTSGLEKALDTLLYGKDGEKRAIQSTVRTLAWEHVPAVDGYDIVTTINIGIQDIVEQELYNMCKEAEPEWATAVVMEVATGEIKAVSNFDLNRARTDYIERMNHAFLGYETGSVMKVISMLVALEDSIVIDTNARMETGRYWNYSRGGGITDAHASDTKSITEVIAHSSNIGIAKIITGKYGNQPTAFKDRLAELGFFDLLHVGIAGEIPPRMVFGKHDNENRIQLSRMSYGYGVTIPPIYTLAMYNAIANDGMFVRPHLVKKFMHDEIADSIVPISYVRERICSHANAIKLREMMRSVVYDPHGTGKSLRNNLVELAGKTGTCYISENGLYTRKKRYAFCGFFPYDAPKYSCIVIFEKGKYGAARSCGRVFKNIALKMYSRGLLGSHADYEADVDSLGRVVNSTLYARVDGDYPALVEQASLKNHRKFRTPGTVAAGEVPDVIGLGLRDAINVLEGAGMKVRFTGTGYVYRQSLPPGSKLIKGAVIELALRN